MSATLENNVHLKSVFRKDINVLRTVAVLAVVFFHFGFSFAEGGYIGVDVFFVISGYLMTSIILSKREAGKFSFSGFYISRFMRILPALAVLCLVLLVGGWFVIFPFDYAYMGRNINHALVFKSNFSFAKGPGYFDTGTDVKWLLHTWSLSVEMQFYLIYPILLFILHKFLSFSILRLVITLLAIASFAGYAWTSLYGDPNQAFYMLWFRAWELLAGAIVVLFPIYSVSETAGSNKKLTVLRILGALLIALSILFASGHSEWTVVWALLGTLGTVFVLATIGSGTVASIPGGKALNNFIHYTGLISYSLYLWHWPIRSLQQYFGLEDNLAITFGAIVATYALAALSYHFVEQKAHMKFPGGKIFTMRTGATVAIFLVPFIISYSGGKYVRGNDGIVQRLESLPFDNIPTYLFNDPELYLLEGIADKCGNNGSPCRLSNGKRLSNKGEWNPDVILMGDSHAMAMAHALSETPKQDDHLKVLLTGSSACIYFEDFPKAKSGDRKFERCKRAYQASMKVLEETSDDVPLLMVNYFEGYMDASRWHQVNYEDNSVALSDAWLKMTCRLSEKRDVYILQTVPRTATPVVKKIVQNVLRGTTDSLTPKDFAITTDQHKANNKMASPMLDKAVADCGVKLIDPAPVYCEDGLCYGTSQDIVPYYRDTTHLNLFGARKMIPLFEKAFVKQ